MNCLFWFICGVRSTPLVAEILHSHLKPNFKSIDSEKVNEFGVAISTLLSTRLILNAKQYDFHNRLAVVMAESLKAAGFKAQLDVVDWATLVSRRGEPAVWDVYVTHSAFLPEPMLSPPQLGDDAPGWWNTPAKQAMLAAFNAETDPKKRGALWGKVQETVYDEVPYIRVGNFAALSGISAKLKGFAPMPWPAFWNVEGA